MSDGRDNCKPCFSGKIKPQNRVLLSDSVVILLHWRLCGGTVPKTTTSSILQSVIVYLYMYAIMNGHIKLKDLKDDPTNEYGLDEMKTQGESFVCENILTCLV